MKTRLLVGVGTGVITSFMLIVALSIAMFWASPAAPVSAAYEASETQTSMPQAPLPKLAICHITDPGAVPLGTGKVINVSQNACVAHCTNHVGVGPVGDQVIGDGACAFAFPDSNQCVVNSPLSATCTVDRCIALCGGAA